MHWMLLYDIVAIVDRTLLYVKKAFIKIVEEAYKIRLRVNERKTNIMVSRSEKHVNTSRIKPLVSTVSKPFLVPKTSHSWLVPKYSWLSLIHI